MPETDYSLKPKAPENPEPSKPASEPSTTSTPIKEEPQKIEAPDAVDYFKIEGWGQLLLEPRLDVYGLKDKIVYIDQFIKNRLFDLGQKPNKEAYDGILQEMEAIIGTSKKTSQEQRISKIYGIIQSLMKQRQDSEFKERALKSLLFDRK